MIFVCQCRGIDLPSSLLPLSFPKDVCLSLLIPPKRGEQDKAIFQVNNPASTYDVFSSMSIQQHIGQPFGYFLHCITPKRDG
jgi:hypothetical protein